MTQSICMSGVQFLCLILKASHSRRHYQGDSIDYVWHMMVEPLLLGNCGDGTTGVMVSSVTSSHDSSSNRHHWSNELYAVRLEWCLHDACHGIIEAHGSAADWSGAILFAHSSLDHDDARHRAKTNNPALIRQLPNYRKNFLCKLLKQRAVWRLLDFIMSSLPRHRVFWRKF